LPAIGRGAAILLAIAGRSHYPALLSD